MRARLGACNPGGALAAADMGNAALAQDDVSDARVLVPLVASARDIMATSNRVVQCNPKTLACWDDLKFKVSNRRSSLLGRTGKAILYQYYERPRRS